MKLFKASETFDDKDCWQSSKLSASLRLFLAMFWEHLNKLLAFRFQTDLGRENSASYLKIQAEEDRCFSTIVTRWSRFTSNFYALIGQNSTGESMRKIYAASWNLFTLTAESDRVSCQLVMFLTVFLLDVQNEIQLP